MKNLAIFSFIALVSLVVVYSTPAPFSFTGSLNSNDPNVGNWPSISWSGGVNENQCEAEYSNSDDFLNYLAWNIYIDSSNSTFYFVVGDLYNQTDDDLEDDFSVYIYNTFTPSSPCSGLYGKGGFQKLADEGPVINDGIWLNPGTYTLVATLDDYSYGGIFALVFTPGITWVAVNNSSPTWNPAIFDNNGDNQDGGNCTTIGDDEDNDDYHYNWFSWTQQTSGWYDIVTLVVNDTLINPGVYDNDVDYTVYNSLYKGYISNVTGFQLDGCSSSNAQWLFGGSSTEEEPLGGLDRQYLIAGWNYTLVTGVDVTEVSGQIAIQVIPSLINFVVSTTPAYNRPYSIDDCSTAGDQEQVPWYAQTFTAQYPITIINTQWPLSDNQISTLSTRSVLYSGNNAGNPPATSCDTLLDIEDTGSEPLGWWTTVGSNYTFVVTDDDEDTNLDPNSSVFRLHYLTGPYVNTASFVVPGTVTGGVTGSTTGVTGVNTGVSGGATATGNTGSGTTGARPPTTTTTTRVSTTSNPQTTTTTALPANSSSTTTISFFVLAVLLLVYFF